MTDYCECGLANPGPEHRAYYPMLCSDKPRKPPPAEMHFIESDEQTLAINIRSESIDVWERKSSERWLRCGRVYRLDSQSLMPDTAERFEALYQDHIARKAEHGETR